MSDKTKNALGRIPLKRVAVGQRLVQEINTNGLEYHLAGMDKRVEALLKKLSFLPEISREILVGMIQKDPIALSLVTLGVDAALDYGRENHMSGREVYNRFRAEIQDSMHLVNLPQFEPLTVEQLQSKINEIIQNHPGYAKKEGLEKSLIDVAPVDEPKYDQFVHMAMRPMLEYFFTEIDKNNLRGTPSDQRNEETRKFALDYAKLIGLPKSEIANFLKATRHFRDETVISMPDGKTGKISTQVLIKVKGSAKKGLREYITIPKWSLFNPIIHDLADFMKKGKEFGTISQYVFDEFFSEKPIDTDKKRRTRLSKRELIMKDLLEYSGCEVAIFERPETPEENSLSCGYSASQMAGPVSPLGRGMNISSGRRFLSDDGRWDAIETFLRHRKMEESNYDEAIMTQIDIEAKITKEIQDVLSDSLGVLREVYTKRMRSLYRSYSKKVDPSTINMDNLDLGDAFENDMSIGKIVYQLEKEQDIHLEMSRGQNPKERKILDELHEETTTELKYKLNNLCEFESEYAALITLFRNDYVAHAKRLVDTVYEFLPGSYMEKVGMWQTMITNSLDYHRITDEKISAIAFTGENVVQMTENLTSEMFFLTKVDHYRSLNNRGFKIDSNLLN